MDSDLSKRLQEGLQDPNWSKWFNSISKEQLWVDLVGEQERIQKYYEDKIEQIRYEQKKDASESRAASNAGHFLWFIIGGIVGTATGFFK